MAAFADRMAATGLRLLTKYGKSITVTRITAPGAYDSSSGKTAAPTTVTVNAKCYPKDFDSSYSNRPNLLLKSGDKQLIISASGFSKPSLGDWFTIDGVKYTIVPIREGGLEIETIFAQEIPVLYYVHGRRS